MAIEHFQSIGSATPAPTALVVDEHEIARCGCVTLLQSHGLGACHQAGSITEASRMFVRWHPAVIVQAWPLGGSHTTQLIRWVRGHAHACPVIVYSDHDDAMGVMDALLAGAVGFITKSSPSAILLEGVRRALRGELYISPDLAQALALTKSLQLDDPTRILSQSEKAVFELTVAGMDLPGVSRRLLLSKRTVSNYLIRIKTKLGADSMADLVRLDEYRKNRNVQRSVPCHNPVPFEHEREGDHQGIAG